MYFEETFEETKKAAKQGNTDAKFWLGFKYYYGSGVDRNLKLSAKWFKEAAHEGHKIAKYNLEYMHRNGEGV